MHTTTSIHQISSEIDFLIKEINFLLKLLRNGYTTSIDTDKIKLLDSYWKGFEDSIKRLHALSAKIGDIESGLGKMYEDDLSDSEKAILDEINISNEFNKINADIKTLKEGFYKYMAGYCACCLKPNLPQ